MTPQDLSKGRYFGGRRPEDGRIPHDASARQIHDLVRALAPPYPGAFVLLQGRRLVIERTQHGEPPPVDAAGHGLRLCSDGAALWLLADNGSALRIVAARCEGDAALLDAHGFESRFGSRCVAIDA